MEEQKLRMKLALLLEGRNNTKINMKVWKKKKNRGLSGDKEG